MSIFLCDVFRQNLLQWAKKTLHNEWSFLFRISSVNVTKSEVFCRFGQIYWRNPYWKTSFFVQWELKYWKNNIWLSTKIQKASGRFRVNLNALVGIYRHLVAVKETSKCFELFWMDFKKFTSRNLFRALSNMQDGFF